ncbi:MAG: SpoIIE family protein phosphatase [Ignavibacteria bacterium]|jgi:sigma-B regulation protein RsbU (phosphoserine phosphatase)
MAEASSLKLKRNLTSLVEFSRTINSSIDLNFILNNVLLTILGKFLSIKGMIALAENGKIVIKNSKGLSNNTLDNFPDLQPENNLLSNKKLLHFMESSKLQAAENIISSDSHIGIVCLGEKLNKTEYTKDDLEFLRTILNISATAIQNSIRINQLQSVNRELDSRIHRLNSLFELSKEFGLFSDSSKVTKLLVFSLLGQFLVSKFAVITFEDDEIHILDSKFDDDALGAELKTCDCEQITRSMNTDDVKKEHPGLSEMGVSIIVPMEVRGKTKGVILLGERINKQSYSDSDIEFIYSVGSLAIISIENKRLFTEELEKRKLEEELDLAREIQQNLLPQSIPVFNNFDIAAVNMSSKQVGGDYYDVIDLDGNKFCAAIADVSGKGAPASLLMANIQAFLQVICREGFPIEESTGIINDLISANTSDGRFITFFWAVFDNENRKMTYVNAGHNPPLLIRDGNIIKLKSGGMILGVMETVIPYNSETVQLNKDDVLVLFTDGISEAMNNNGEEYSDERLEKYAVGLTGYDADKILNKITTNVHDFTDGAPQSDDITMVIIKVR